MGMLHDLEVWKITKQLQIQNSPEFDEFFIQFGQIHSISSIGKILYGRGAVYLLSEAKMIAGGSTNTFLRGKLLCKCNAWFAS